MISNNKPHFLYDFDGINIKSQFARAKNSPKTAVFTLLTDVEYPCFGPDMPYKKSTEK